MSFLTFFASWSAEAADAHEDLFLVLNPDPETGGSAPALVVLARLASSVLPEVVVALMLLGLLLGPRVRVQRHRLLIVLAAMGLAWLAARALQSLWPQPRPFVVGLGTPWLAHPASPSFPSMHSTVAWAWAASLVLWRKPWVTALAVITAALIAWSRVGLGVHFPIDVTVGAMLGICAALFTHMCFSPLRLRWMQCVGRRTVRRQRTRWLGAQRVL
ncbi:phosphatase PAP2 family protein [Xenophilus arseniciresistens]|uniref:Phosphatase PAP2 family protein n=1 Tax=Xenophilus arseniciresistens TaxID=1283306 RepID=A0AAE3N852_9BURK|nr:phosphatase PAP2 family protein [Xenophilus arseniciresistens]MDA7416338.1 phosphatase PAP2 family protein [Xenophilus arseniciresistens]